MHPFPEPGPRDGTRRIWTISSRRQPRPRRLPRRLLRRVPQRRRSPAFLSKVRRQPRLSLTKLATAELLLVERTLATPRARKKPKLRLGRALLTYCRPSCQRQSRRRHLRWPPPCSPHHHQYLQRLRRSLRRHQAAPQRSPLVVLFRLSTPLLSLTALPPFLRVPRENLRRQRRSRKARVILPLKTPHLQKSLLLLLRHFHLKPGLCWKQCKRRLHSRRHHHRHHRRNLRTP